jgi:hypothetical protein
MNGYAVGGRFTISKSHRKGAVLTNMMKQAAPGFFIKGF